MLASSVNDSARKDEGILARWHKDTNGSIASGGTGDVITVAANRTLSAYYDGLVMAFDATAANTGATTLNVDGVAAAAIVKNVTGALVANDIVANQKVIVIYSTANSNWQIVSPLGNTAVTLTGAETLTNKQMTTIELGHATDTTITRASAGDMNIEGNIAYRAGGTDVPVTDGGTGASTASAARTNLGLSIGANVQAYDATLQGIADVGVIGGGQFLYGAGSDAFAVVASVAYGRSLLALADAAAARSIIEVDQIAPQLSFANDGTTLATGATLYLGVGRDSATELNVITPTARAGTAQRMHVYATASPGTSETYIATLRSSLGDTALTVTLSNAEQTGSDLVNTVALAAGALLTVKVVASGGANPASNIAVSIEYGD